LDALKIKNKLFHKALLIGMLCLVLAAMGSKNLLTAPYERIICAAPSVTEIVFSLGLGDQVVGVSHFAVYPPEAKNKKSIGGLINPSRERITALKPDLVLTQGKHERLAELCRKQDITFVSVNIENTKDIYKAILELGSLLGAAQQAQKLIQHIKTDISSLTSQVQPLSKKKVFLCLSHTPGDLTGLMTTGEGTFLDEIIEMAGGINIFSDLKKRYPRVSKESLIMRQPDIIIEIYAKGLNANQQEMLRKDWDRLSLLPAVRNSRIHFLTDDYLLIPGVRINLILRKFIQTIHPEVRLRHD
jgi:iron complex transport system substrate-binding protein